MHDPDHPDLTTDDIAHRLHVTVTTVRRWLRAGRLRGRYHGGSIGWRIPPAELDKLTNTWPDISHYDLSTETIAAETGRNVRTVHAWFTRTIDPLPGTKFRYPTQRSAVWRTTRTDFNRWYGRYLRTNLTVTETPT